MFNNSRLDDMIRIIKGKAHCCDCCFVPEKIKNVLHVMSLYQVFCDECYHHVEKKLGRTCVDDVGKKYPRDGRFWLCKYLYGDLIDFSSLVFICDVCKKEPRDGYREFEYHITIHNGKATTVTCHECFSKM